MAISDNVQTFSAVFSFGLLLQAATSALLIYFRGHASTIFQDHRRLVLVVFLISAALWAQIDFLNFLIPTSKTTLCQATIIFSTMFDQIARITIGGFLLWTLGHGTRSSAERYGLGALLGLRTIAGLAFIGFTRPQFAPVCIARSELMPLSIIVVALDGLIVGVLVIQVLQLRLSDNPKNQQSSETQDHNRALAIVAVGFFIWTAMSITMILGLKSIILLLRTTIPSIGLFIVVGILTIFEYSLLSYTGEMSSTPEARSPFVIPPPQSLQQKPVGDGSPVVGHRYTSSGTLFVVNPSDTPTESPIVFPGGGFKAEKSPLGYGETKVAVNAREVGGSASGSNSNTLLRSSNGMFQYATNSSESDSPVTKLRAPSFSFPRQGSPTIAPVTPPTAQQKLSLFKRGRPPLKQNVRSLGISQPIMEVNENEEMPFARMKTIDLATAAVEERARREAAVDTQRLIANRPAPPPPLMKPAEGLLKSISTKRKEGPVKSHKSKSSMDSLSSSSSSNVSSGKSMEANGTSTSASLSPGRDEVRRRSPRTSPNAKSFEAFDEKPLRLISPIRRKPSIGLPSGPRANIPSNPRPVANAEPQRIMFVKDIVYDEPDIVQSIIDSARTPSKPWTKAQEYNLHSADSMIHRPRPYRRNTEEDRAIFPAEPYHRRTKSGGSVMNRKSNLFYDSGNPNNLPPLPQPPTSARELKKLLPTGTNSMTVDEKIQLLFPAPPETPRKHQRHSSVPTVPRIPSAILAAARSNETEYHDFLRSNRISKRSTIASMSGILAPLVPTVPALTPDDATYRFSVDTYRFITEMDPLPWMQELPKSGSNRRSSPLEPQFYEDEQDEVENPLPEKPRLVSHPSIADTAWESLHSPALPIDVSKKFKAAPTLFMGGKKADVQNLPRVSRDLPSVPQEQELDDQQEFMTIMLDPAEVASMNSNTIDNRTSFLLDDGKSLPATPDSFASIESKTSTWHKRIGDELPTFSDRQKYRKSRAMPPPAPLLLGNNGRNATVVVLDPKPAALDTPERAIAEIQAQLKKFENEPNRGSVGSLLRRIPAGTPSAAEEQSNRLRLLENLEQEMGLQESHWMKMQQNMDRNSTSTVGGLPSPPAEAAEQRHPESQSSPQAESQRNSRSTRPISRRARIRSNVSKTSESALSTSTMSSETSRASVWQRRLAEAQMEYLENAPTLLNNRAALNFLSVGNGPAQLGSPTPPDSLDSSTDIDTESDNDEHTSLVTARPLPPKAKVEPVTLWQALLKPARYAEGRLWSPTYGPKLVVESPVLPAKSIRPPQRTFVHSLQIASTSLWAKTEMPSAKTTTGLWGSRPVRPTIITSKKAIQKPERKSRRMTFLPDILESPEPLPNKRDTLGIFQFPWGERSDNAVSQPQVIPAVQNNNFPFINHPPQLAFEVDSEMADYESSFFDDYDEDFVDDEEESEDDFYDSEDEFDESTLWEIANMLNSTNIPSRNSLFPPQQNVIEDYDNSDYEVSTSYVGSDDEDFEMELKRPAAHPDVKFPIQPLAKSTNSKDLLWANKTGETSKAVVTGLPQPESPVWQRYAPAEEDDMRTKSRPESRMDILETRDMWSSPEPSTPQRHTFCLWNNRPASVELQSTEFNLSAKYLWSPESSSNHESTRFWLADVSRISTLFNIEPIVTSKVKSHHYEVLKLPKLASKDLWAKEIPSIEIGKSTTGLWGRVSTLGRVGPIPRSLWSPEHPKKKSSSRFWLVDTSIIACPTTVEPAMAPRQVKACRSERLGLPKLASNDLWINAMPLIQIGRSHRRMWSQTNIVRSPPVFSPRKSVGVKSRDISISMWTPTTPKKVQTSVISLFTPSKTRSDFRVTNAIPSALSMVRAPRAKNVALPSLQTHEVWAPSSQQTTSTRFWIMESSKSSKITNVGNLSTDASMWAAPERPLNIATLGLFDARIPRCDFRTSSGEPAALTMVKAPRKADAELPVLESKNLWRISKAIAIEHHWVTESSVRAVSPSLYSPSSDSERSDRPSMASETASIASVSTKASSIWSTFSNATTTTVKKPSWWESKSKRTPSPPRDVGRVEDQDRSKIPVGRPQKPTNGPSRDSKILANRSMWESVNQKPTRVPSFSRKLSLKRDTKVETLVDASFPDNAILKSASSVNRHDRSHRGATSSQWASALEEALARRPSDLWMAAPVEIIAPIVTSSLWVAPPTARARRADIFATKSAMIKKVATAQIGLPVLTSSKLWTVEKTAEIPEQNWIITSSKSTITEATEQVYMWTAPIKGHNRQRSLFTDAMDKEVKRSSPKPTMELPSLESSQFWQPRDVIKISRDWISESSIQPTVQPDLQIESPRPIKPSQTWVAPQPLEALEALLDSSAMWNRESTNRHSPNLFSNIKPEPVKRTPSQRTHAIKKLESDAFWKPSGRVVEKKDWIRVSVAAVPEEAQLWTPPVRRAVQMDEEMSLWKSQVVEEFEEAAVFGSPHGPWVKAKRTPIPLTGVRSRGLWRPSREIPESPRNWLIKSRFSKVQFRY